MDRIEPDREPEEPDGAEQAFEALREEVASLRRGVELIYRRAQEGQGSAAAGPDYSLTLGAIAKELTSVIARLDAIERAPALATTPGQLAAELRRELHQAGEDARRGLAHSQVQLDGTVRELRGMMASARDRDEQRRWLWSVGGVSVMGGALLWFLLTALLPWSGGTWLAGLAFGGRLNAGQVMLQEANPDAWERMVRLYKACPQDSKTELCEAAVAVRTAVPTGAPTPVMPRASSFGTMPATRGSGR